MNILVYEFITAITDANDHSSASVLLRAEGLLMRNALCADLAPLATIHQIDSIAPADERAHLESLARSCDATIIIAPEFDGILAERCAWVRETGSRVIASSAEALSLTSDKLALAAHWHDHGIPTPPSFLSVDAWRCPYPQVWKRRDGAGSLDMRIVDAPGPDCPPTHIAQPLHRGRAASVAFLIGEDRCEMLPPCWQHLSNDGRFHYQGGECPIPAEWAERASRIARRAISVVPGLLGYIGVDVLLCDTGDVAIEINPRLTTSYTGLRQLCRSNLAEGLLATIGLRPWPQWEWNRELVRFRSDNEPSTVIST